MQQRPDGIAYTLKLLQRLGRRRLRFQADLADRCLQGIIQKERLLITAPTGTGKTLISQLAIARLCSNRKDIPRVIVIVPGRGLAIQHFDDAAWMREIIPIALHKIHADTPLYQISELLQSYGVFFTTPITLSNRLSLPGFRESLSRFDCAIFDEIDLTLTVDEQDERRDTFPALKACMEAQLPILGFTGTGLTSGQFAAWEGRGFEKIQVQIPREWLPLTNVRFVGIADGAVITADADIRSQLSSAFQKLAAMLGRPGRTVSWGDVKRHARAGSPSALQIMRLCTQRLELFESFGSSQGKLHAIRQLVIDRSPSLILSRFRRSSAAIKEEMQASGLLAEVAHGGMRREDIGTRLDTFRSQGREGRQTLILTRDLGGRGLDFSDAASACIFSPRSNYQTVAQELARIRSRSSSPKTVLVLYYRNTEEEAKARRLGLKLRAQRYEGNPLFVIEDLPGADYELTAPFEGRLMAYEESIKDPDITDA